MSGGADAGLVYACLTHVPLWVDYPSYVTPIYSGLAQAPGLLNLRDLAPEWEPHHPVLGGSAGAFAFKNYLLKQHPQARMVGICQYRKFVSRRRIGKPARNYKAMDMVSKGKLKGLQLEQVMLPHDARFLVSRPWRFTTIRTNYEHLSNYDYLCQYQHVHHVEDFLRFTAQAVECGVLHKDEVHAFFQQTIFFPGGIELGIFPADFWIRSITAMEDVVRACVNRYPTRREPAQARLWSFCMERLGSYLLMKQLRLEYPGENWMVKLLRHLHLMPMEENWIAKHRGHMNLITEDESLRYVPGT